VVCVVRQRFLPQDDDSSRGVLPAVVCRVESRNLKNEAMARGGPQRPRRGGEREIFLLLRVQLMRLGIIDILEFCALLGYSFLDFLNP
jgi:hypothetical protein